MALYSITQGGAVNALDIQQVMNLLTGIMTDQTVTIQRASGLALALNFSGSAAINALLNGQRGGTSKWYLGLDASDHFAIINAAGTTVTFLVDDSGNASTTGTLKIGSRPAFVTGDKYLIVDSNGNVHVSSLGPAS